MKFHGMEVLEFSEKRKYRYWKVRCHCGKIFESRTDHLICGSRKSCGCVLKTQNGLSRKFRPEYQTWIGMKQRCYNPRVINYNHYGGRGITVCARWKDSFLNFLEDMGKRPSSDHSLDRTNNDLGYSPENCQWRLSDVQQNNRRDNIRASLRGKTQTLKQWSRETGMNYDLLIRRKRDGWSDGKLLTTPRKNANFIVSRDSRGRVVGDWPTYPFST